MELVKITRFISAAVLLMLIFVASPVMAQECGLTNWDEDGDRSLATDEFDAALMEVDYYGTWDTDADGSLTEEEWNTGVTENLGSYSANNFTEWDADGNQEVSDQEFNEGIFGLVDENDDDMIDETEWSNFDQEGDDMFC